MAIHKLQSTNLKELLAIKKYSWKSILIINFVSAFLFMLAEWTFTITKASFFGNDTFLDKLVVLPFSITTLFLICCLFILVMYLLSHILIIADQRIFKGVSLTISVFLDASMVLLLVDNFTYTLFNFGIVISNSFRVVYLVFYLLLLVFFHVALNKKAYELSSSSLKENSRNWVIPALIGLSLVIFSLTIRTNHHSDEVGTLAPSKHDQNLPDIILITADGLDTMHMSVYGYERETTPEITHLATTSLLAENAFTNSGNTSGSLISIFTSKYPTTTRVLYPPDILKNEDSYQHVLALLKDNGYTTAQISFAYYGDAYETNLLNGFDAANGRTTEDLKELDFLTRNLDTNEAHFLYQVKNRLFDRLCHIFFIRNMVDLNAFTKWKTITFDDRTKLTEALEFLQQNKKPVFIHIHWMETHGPVYKPKVQVFSKGQDVTTQEEWNYDFYDDSILDFDSAVGNLIKDLKELGLYDNTVLILGSDHGQHFRTYNKVPLIIHFPGDAFSGSITDNVQNIDISPTLLDYLQIEQPDWMEGTSFLHGSVGNRPIFSVGVDAIRPEWDHLVAYNFIPPFYQFGYMNLVYCDQFFTLQLKDYEWSSGTVQGHTGNCPQEIIISEEQAFNLIVNHLIEEGFNVETIGSFPTVHFKED
ncbi:MAG: sulfatase-like hydrolase/transferase [Bacillota bacterium]